MGEVQRHTSLAPLRPTSLDLLNRSGNRRAFKLSGEGGDVYGQNGVNLSFFRALFASIWGHCSQVLVSTGMWGTQKKGATMTLFVLFFPALGRENTKMTNRLCFTSRPGGDHFHCTVEHSPCHIWCRIMDHLLVRGKSPPPYM